MRRVIAATYQAASGAGAAAMEELRASTEAYLANRAYQPRVLPHPYAFNVFSHNDKVDPESGANGEEIKVARELKKMMGAPELRIGVTCVRVPVLRAHTIAMTVEFERRSDARCGARDPWRSARRQDRRRPRREPLPDAARGVGHDDILVGRLRADASDPTGHSISMLVAGDQLLKGAALNAVQIAEFLPQRAMA